MASLVDIRESKSSKKAGKKQRKYGRNKIRCLRYRTKVGKPRGKGVPGNKLGKNRS